MHALIANELAVSLFHATQQVLKWKFVAINPLNLMYSDGNNMQIKF